MAQSGTEWEVGIGTYTLSGTTLARTTVLSNKDALTIVKTEPDVFVLMVLFASPLQLALIAGIVILAALGVDGWGWLFFALIVTL